MGEGNRPKPWTDAFGLEKGDIVEGAMASSAHRGRARAAEGKFISSDGLRPGLVMIHDVSGYRVIIELGESGARYAQRLNHDPDMAMERAIRRRDLKPRPFPGYESEHDNY